MSLHRRAVLVLGASTLLPGCNAISAGRTENSKHPVTLANIDTEAHWLAVRVKGDEQSSYVQEFAAHLDPSESEELCEQYRPDEIEGGDLELELRIDDEVRTRSVPRGGITELYVSILEDGSITFEFGGAP